MNRRIFTLEALGAFLSSLLAWRVSKDPPAQENAAQTQPEPVTGALPQAVLSFRGDLALRFDEPQWPNSAYDMGTRTGRAVLNDEADRYVIETPQCPAASHIQDVLLTQNDEGTLIQFSQVRFQENNLLHREAWERLKRKEEVTVRIQLPGQPLAWLRIEACRLEELGSFICLRSAQPYQLDYHWWDECLISDCVWDAVSNEQLAT